MYGQTPPPLPSVPPHRDITALQAILWFVAVSVVCALLAVYGLFYSRLEYANPLYAMGLYFLPAAAIWALFHLLFERQVLNRCNIRPAFAGASFVFIYVSLCVTCLTSAQRDIKDAHLALAVINDQIASQVSEGETPPHSRADAPELTGTAAEMTQLTGSYIDAMAHERQAYEAAITAAGWDTLLDADRLSKDTGYTKSDSILAAGQAAYDAYNKKLRAVLIDYNNRVQQLDISKPVWRGFQQGWNRQMQVVKPQIERNLDLEQESIREIGEMLKILKQPKTWQAESGQIAFLNDDEMNKYNSHFHRVQEIVAEQDKIQKSLRENSTQQVKKNTQSSPRE